MTNILPLRSGTIDPIFVDLFRAVDTAARTTGHEFLVFGATARDLVLEGVYGIAATRKTRDVDLAFALRSWNEYDALKESTSRVEPIHAGRSHPPPPARP